MAHGDPFSRRDFFKSAGAVAGAAGLGGLSKDAIAAATMAQDAAAAAPPSPIPEPAASPFPAMNRRTLGWLRFLWEKATTRDDWSSTGIPHPWWDRYTSPVVLSYGRFDLSYSAYGVLMMADQTPAWREVYSRITDEFAQRYPTYWGAIDWLTQIGDDPKRARYPPQIMATLPPDLRGNYNRFGWVANGVRAMGPPEGSDRRGRVSVLPRLVPSAPRDAQVRIGQRQVGESVQGHRLRRRGIRVGSPPSRDAPRGAVPHASRRSALREHEDLVLLQQRRNARHVSV